MHGKAAVIEPALAKQGLRFVAPPPIDTDRFGTFTRDVARAGSQREALLAKAQAGLDHVPEADFAAASEGAFGPHPQMPFLPAGHEMVALLERSSGQAVIGRHLTSSTNFLQAQAASQAEVHAFADRVGFPEHALIVMADRAGPILAKGVTDAHLLATTCAAQCASGRPVWLEADMRAHFNPTRMAAIAAATDDLIRRLTARCPICAHPDWVPQTTGGRPCKWCGGATIEPWIEAYSCDACGHSAERIVDPDRAGSPAHCGDCNP
jgi:hypothetical protein